MFNEVNELKHINNIVKRDEADLKQWLTVSANGLVRAGKLVKIKSHNRKNGVIYGCLDI